MLEYQVFQLSAFQMKLLPFDSNVINFNMIAINLKIGEAVADQSKIFLCSIS